MRSLNMSTFIEEAMSFQEDETQEMLKRMSTLHSVEVPEALRFETEIEPKGED